MWRGSYLAISFHNDKERCQRRLGLEDYPLPFHQSVYKVGHYKYKNSIFCTQF